MILNFEPGDKVINPLNKDWGIGQVQSSIKEKITKYIEKMIVLLDQEIFIVQFGVFLVLQV